MGRWTGHANVPAGQFLSIRVSIDDRHAKSVFSPPLPPGEGPCLAVVFRQAGGRGLGFDYATRAVWAADPAHPGSVFALCIWQAPRSVFCPGNKLPENGEAFLGRDAESASLEKKPGRPLSRFAWIHQKVNQFNPDSRC